MNLATVNGRRSAYPPAVAELLPRAVDLAIDLGEVPSRNRLMAAFRIGATRASAVREAVESGGIEWSTVRRLVTSAEMSEYVDQLRQHVFDQVDGGGPDRARLVAVAGPHPDPTPAVDADDTIVVDEAFPLATAPADRPGPTPHDPDPPASDPPGHTAVRDPDAPSLPDHPDPTPTAATEPGPLDLGRPVRIPRSWPLVIIAIPAAVAIWSGWVGLGQLTGFGPVNLLPGIGAGFTINTAITLPVGVEAYAAYALRVWLTGSGVPVRARRFARWSALSSLVVGISGQGAYHLMTALGWTAAPWPVVVTVSALPVAVLGMAAGLTHLLRASR